jgi:hypothetical protein
MNQFFYINGYWKDNGEKFEDYLVCSGHLLSKDDKFVDEEILFYGMNEIDINKSIKSGKESNESFVVTSYRKAQV